MIPNDLKKLDKRIRQISDPFGSGFPVLRGIMVEIAERNGIPIDNLVLEYVGWKWKR